MRSSRLLLLGCSFVVLAMLLWYAQSILTLFPKLPDPQRLPTYPNAQQIQTSDPQQVGFADRITTSFKTVDSPDTVLAFYRDQMIADGWQAGAIGDREHVQLGFTARGCPFYYVYVITSQPQPGQTHVEVQFNKELCR